MSTQTQQGFDPEAAIKALENQLARTPRGTRPMEHGAIAYRLGLAYAESPVGNAADNLRKALACYEVAAGIFDPRYDPVEHARAINAAGAAHRGLGRPKRALELFQKAADLLEDRDRDHERAAALNNLGLARTEAGEFESALDDFELAASLFDDSTPEGRRGKAAALHNRGLAHAATGTVEGLKAAIDDYAEARAAVDTEEAPYHCALIDHSTGIAATALAAQDPDQKRRWVSRAVTSFQESLAVFTRKAFPSQHALAKHNQGRALVATGEVDNLRRALASFEEVVALFDPRVQRDEWRQAYASLEAAEKALEDHPSGSLPGRAGHFVALAATCSSGERTQLLRERLPRLVALPGEKRHAAMVELAVASALLGPELAKGYIETELNVLMELPNEGVEAGLAARVDAHRRLPDAQREALDRAFDQAVGDALGMTQRILVRDHLASLGFERP